MGIISDFENAAHNISILVPSIGIDKIMDDFGVAPHMERIEGQALGELGYDDQGAYYVVNPDEYVSIFGQEVTTQEGINKVVEFKNGEYRLYVSHPENIDADFRDTGGFGKWMSDNFWGMAGTSQVHDIRGLNPNYNGNSSLGFGELFLSGVTHFFINGYYSIGKGNNPYIDKQTGGNITIRGQ